MNALVNVTPAYSVPDIERMARAFATSKLFGVQNPEQALALCLVAQAEGRHPASAAQDYHIINGRPSKKADAMLRDFLAGGGRVEWHALSDDIADATFSHPAGGSVRITWDHDRAKLAQISTPMWKKYPRQMLRSRTVSEGVRTVFPMATSGMYVPEEAQDIPPARDVQVAHVEDVTHEAADFEPTHRGTAVMGDGPDFYECPVDGAAVLSAHAAKKAGLDDRHTTILNALREAASYAELKGIAAANLAEIGTMPLSWRQALREAFDERLAEIRTTRAA
jgi:hypothetical protein